MKKKLLSCLLAVTLTIGSVMPTMALQAREIPESQAGADTLLTEEIHKKGVDAPESGACGDNAAYTLDSEGTLTISGTGAIKSEAFSKNSDVTNVIVQEGITSIGSLAFSDCSNLVTIDLPDSLNEIEWAAFTGCSSLEKMEIPKSVTVIGEVGETVFSGCSNLVEIAVDSNNPNYSSVDGILYDKTQKTLLCCPGGKEGIIEVPDTVTEIAGRAFLWCEKITGVTIPSGIQKINYKTFQNCTNLKEIAVPEGVTAIDDDAFYSSGLENITLPDSLESIGFYSFTSCKKLKGIEIPQKVTEIDRGAFQYCTLLEQVKIPESVQSIGSEVFDGCSGNLVLSVVSGSYGETYAKENRIKYELPDGTIVEPTEPEDKELVQYSNDWTIFRYLDDEGEPTFDIRYMGKTESELREDKLGVQFRTIYQNDMEFELTTSLWRGLSIPSSLKESIMEDIENHKNSYFIQFRVTDVNDTDDVTAISDILPIYIEEYTCPYIVSASYENYECLDCYSFYDLETRSNSFKVTLKLSEQLEQTDTPEISIIAKDGSWDEFLFDYSASNLSYENQSEEYVIDGNNYKLEYALLTFDINLSPVTYDDYFDSYIINYNFTFSGIEGMNTHNKPSAFILRTKTPTTSTPIEKDTISVQSIKITAPSNTVKPGNSLPLTATVLPEDATDKSLTWSSSNPSYAAVDDNGIVTAKAAGAGKTVVITAEANDGSRVKSSITIQIQPIASKAIPVSSIKLSADKTTIPAGGKVTVKAKVAPGNATNKAVTWKSSNTKYATVNTKGVVTTKAAGAGKTVTITATAKDGSGRKASIKIKIAKVKVSSIKLSAGSKSVKAGKKITVKAKVLPANATTKAVTWKSSNKKYATVSSKGVVTAKKAGKGKTVTITAEARDGSGKKGTIKIKIK